MIKDAQQWLFEKYPIKPLRRLVRRVKLSSGKGIVIAGKLNLIDFSSLLVLSVTDNEINELIFSPNNFIPHLDVSFNSLNSLPINLNPEILVTLNLNNNKIVELDDDLKSFVNLRFLFLSGNNLNRLDLSNFENLIKLDCSFNKLSFLNLQNCSNLTNLNCDFTNNQLIKLILPNDGNWTKVNVSNNFFTDLKQIVNLDKKLIIEFNLSYNKFFNLDFSEFTSLKKLNCDENKLLVNISLNKNENRLQWLSCLGNNKLNPDFLFWLKPHLLNRLILPEHLNEIISEIPTMPYWKKSNEIRKKVEERKTGYFYYSKTLQIN